MMDLIIRGGTVVDGTLAEPREADIGISGGKIVEVGRIAGRGAEEIDAKGKIVTPGFLDIHTHYDGQALWAEEMAPSSAHGVTTAVIGNCGVGFAPCRRGDEELLIAVMEVVDDIPGAVMAAGLDWDWETFPHYLDALARRQSIAHDLEHLLQGKLDILSRQMLLLGSDEFDEFRLRHDSPVTSSDEDAEPKPRTLAQIP